MRFEDFARACGVDIRRLRDDGKIHRCPTLAHPRSTNGAYAFDGTRGWVMAWDAGGHTQWYDDPNAQPMTDEQRAEWKRRQDAERREKELKQKEAAGRAQFLINECSLEEHGYLRLKGFPKMRGLVDRDGGLVVPMRNLHTNALQGAQRIYWDDETRAWVKKMVPGMRAKGAVLRLGPAAVALTVLCEGFATGLSIQAALDQMRLRAAVLVCFSDHNMVQAAEMVAGRVIVAADHDHPAKLTGLQAGHEAARQIGAPYFMAPTLGHDANDWHQAAGLMPLCAAIMAARREVTSAAA